MAIMNAIVLDLVFIRYTKKQVTVATFTFSGAESLLLARRRFHAYHTLGKTTQAAFVHVPKCGGTSLWSALNASAAAAKLRIQPSDSNRLKSGVYDLVGQQHLYFSEILADWVYQDNKQLEDDYRNTSIDRPSNRLYIVLLRNPIERIKSHYSYVQGYCSPNPGENAPMTGKLQHAHHDCHFFHGRKPDEIVRMIADGYLIRSLLSTTTRHQGTDLLACCTNKAELEEAKANLRESFIVGVLDEIQKFQVVLDCYLWWYSNDKNMEKRNKSPRAAFFDHVSRPLWEHATQLDMQLYEYAKELLQVDYELCTSDT